MTNTLKTETPDAPNGWTRAVIVLSGALSIGGVIGFVAAGSTDARVRLGFEDALVAARTATLPRVLGRGPAFDPSAIHLSRHVPGEPGALVAVEDPQAVTRRPAEAPVALGSVPRLGERVLLTGSDGRLETFVVKAAAPVLVTSPGDASDASEEAHAGSKTIAQRSPTFVLVTLETADALGDGHPPRTLRMVVEVPAGDPVAPAPRRLVKAL